MKIFNITLIKYKNAYSSTKKSSVLTLNISIALIQQKKKEKKSKVQKNSIYMTSETFTIKPDVVYIFITVSFL